MAINFKTADEFSQFWRTYLKATKPDVNISNEDSNFWTLSKPIGQVLSGVSADLKSINNDVFIQDARTSAIESFLIMYFNSSYTPATQSNGDVIITGTEGSILTSGTQVQFSESGITFLTQDDATIDVSLTATVKVISTGTGQNQNLIAGTLLNIPAPPTGIDSVVTVGADGINDGRDQETPDQARERLLARVRVQLSGGKLSDYENFAFKASPAVTGAATWRYSNGLGSLTVIITSGTTNIRSALDNNIPITYEPSDDLIKTVSDYIYTQKVATDCVTVTGPATIDVDVVVQVKYSQGDGTTIPAGQTLTQEEFVIREVQFAIWNTPVGGWSIDGQGYVVASSIEDVLDQNLGNSQYAFGDFVQILSDRFVENLDGLNRNISVPINTRAVPGVITVVEI